jgi:hypothetical protein
MKKDHREFISSEIYKDHVKPILEQRLVLRQEIPTQMYIKGESFRDHIFDQKRVPSLTTDPAMFLDTIKYTKWLFAAQCYQPGNGANVHGELTL